MTVKEITQKWLSEKGYDGLCCEYCGCGLNDFMPCGDSEHTICEIHDCQPAYRIEYESPACKEWHEFCECECTTGCYKPAKTPIHLKEQLDEEIWEISTTFAEKFNS